MFDLLLHFSANTGGSEKISIEDATDVVVQLENSTNDASTPEFPDGTSCPSCYEEEEENVSKSSD